MEELLCKSDANPMLTSTVGRTMNTLLGSRSKKLEDAISHLGSGSQRGSGVSLEESLWFLQKYVKDAIERSEPLDQILVPMLEHSLKFKDSKHGNQVLILLNWLFQDKFNFQALAINLAEIIMRKGDHYIVLSWCALIRELVDYGITMSSCSSNGIRENYYSLLKILCSSISHLSYVLCNGSIFQDGFELPTRLAVAASDCTLALTQALTKEAETCEKNIKTLDANPANWRIISADNCEKEMKTSRLPELPVQKIGLDFLLWDHVEELIIVVEKLLAWSRKSRHLHAKGVEKVLKWLKEIKGHYGSLQEEAGGKFLETGVLVLSSCWKHYGRLLQIEDHRFSLHYKELLEQYIRGMQYFMDSYTNKHCQDKDSGMETRKFFLNCLSLLLGRLDSRQFRITMSEYGCEIAHLLLSQVQCTDEDVIDVAVLILRATIFRRNSTPAESSLLDTGHMDKLLPLLLNLLDERDGTARAVVLLIAEYLSISTDGHCLQEVLKRLASENLVQRRNAIDVVSEFIHISTCSVNLLSTFMWKDIVNHLIECLRDEELAIRKQASNLFPMIDPSLVLPAIVCHVYSPDARMQSSASDAIIAILQHHKQNLEVIYMLLDCLSNLHQSSDHQKVPGEKGEGSKLDVDQVLRLIPEWSKKVEDWNKLAVPLINKMFAEPSNATIVRFLSYISEHLAEAADAILHLVLLRMKDMDESLEKGTHGSEGTVKLQHSLFDRLCPLLVIKLLPLRVFNDLNSSIMYGQLPNHDIIHAPSNRDLSIHSHDCVTALLVKRAVNKFEFEDVQKLAAELCGRIHPEVLLPIMWSQLEVATSSQDILKIKACLFSVCTSLVVQGSDSALHPYMLKIRKILEIVLLWPSLDGDEVSKAQHGCIDCLALMVCAELQDLDSTKDLRWNKMGTFEEDKRFSGEMFTRNSVLNYVIQRLTHDRCEEFPLTKFGDETHPDGKARDTEFVTGALIPLSFRLCMANVLISACQKVSSSGKTSFAQRTLPILIHSVEEMVESEARAACLQVLFSAVYHLKATILPYSPDILKISVKALRKGSEKERIASAKLMASLMGSEDIIVESISGGLHEARSVLSSISSKDPSIQLRQICEKLLVCLTSPHVQNLT